MKQTKKISNHTSPSPISALKLRLATDRLTGAILGITFIVAVAIVLATTQFGTVFPLLRPSDYKIGSVAERDYVVERDILYLDQEATRLKREAAGKLVMPIFRVNERIGEERLQSFSEFRERLLALRREGSSLDTVFLKLQVEFPGVLSKEQLDRLPDINQLSTVFEQAGTILGQIFETGLIKLPG